jgi:thiol-disulfide isomerase/thioredoxin
MIRWFGRLPAEPTKIQQVGENMKSCNTLFSLVFLLGVLLAACGGAVTPEAMMEDSHDETVTEPTHDATMDDSMSSPEADMNESADMMEDPAWFSASLTDARTGQTFSITDFQGKVVLVETMAIWCSNCLKQQGQVKTLHERLGARDDFISVGLDIDPNENTAALKSYVESKEFDWWYAVPSADVSQEIASLYGNQFLNPPSTSIVVIDRHGEAHPLPFGIKSADNLMQAIQPFLDESL